MRLIDRHDLPLQPRKFLMQKHQSVEDSICIPDQLNLVHSQPLEAKAFRTSEPWVNTKVDV